MKPLNETRINATLKYIEDYYARHHVCPTYRQIKDDCEYSSLSLVHSDIDRLKERGLIVDDNRQIKLAKFKDEVRYNYPFIIMTDALHNLDLLNGDEKTLLESHVLYLKGNYLKALEVSNHLSETTSDPIIKFGTRFTKCCCSMFTGDPNPWKDFFRLMVTYTCQTVSEKMEKELLVHFLSGALGGKENCPEWLKEGRFYGLRKKAIPLAKLCFVANAIKSENPVSPAYLEPLCSDIKLEHIDICQVYMDLYMAMSYHYVGDDKYLESHLNDALDTCIKNDWITPLAEMQRPLGNVLNPLIMDKDEHFLKRVLNLQKELLEGYNKIYSILVGENPVKGLTFREIEIINYIRLDLSNKEIADKLYLSTETIKYYLSSIYLKLGISSRGELKSIVKKAVVK